MSTSIEQRLREQLKQALRARDRETANTIRMISTRVTERTKARGFTGEVDDALYVDVIAAYSKSLEKAIVEFAAGGERGLQQIAELEREIAICARWLPEPLDADATREAVRAAIAELGVTDARMAGRVIGTVIKAHKGRVDAALIKQIVGQELA